METLQKKSVRQQTTIVHAAITGFNDWSNNPELEDISVVLNKCFEIIKSVVSLYEGSVEDFSSDEITAVFGNPDFTEKTPFNAINAAIDLRNKIAEVNNDMELPVPIDIKVGIQSGIVLVGKIGGDSVRRNTILGETVTIASRICDIAENGQVLIGKEVFDKTKDKFEFLALEPVPIKGKKKPLPLYEVKGRKKVPVNMGEKSSRMINSEMVGRKMEFDQLEKQIMQLINGRGSVVNIVGKAGIGKSRLMAEMRQSELSQRITVFEGRALSNGQNLSFHPIIQIIKSWAGITEEDTIEAASGKLESNIRRIYPEAFEEIFPFIATMMGYKLNGKANERIKGIEGEALEKLILKNMRDLLAKASSILPVVIVIEDAHWCDVSSIIFMESLFKLVQKQRILFVNVFRPDHKETGDRVRKFLQENLKDYLLEINIEPLTKDESDLLIDNLLHKVELPDEINSLVIERASGNPFFIEEVIRSFIDEGMIEIKENKFFLTDNIKYANIPESIDNVLLSRIDRLDDKTKSLLRTASVIGRNFYYKVLEEATHTIEEIDNKLEYLKDVQLINERTQKDEVAFLFKHALAQQATYDSIVEKSRKDIHLKIAGSIEKVFAGRIHEFYGTLAHHYSKAGQQEKTEEYLIKAGEESMKSGAFSEAINFIKKALEIYIQNTRNLPDQQKVIDLEEKLGFALFATGKYTEAVDKFDKVICFYHKSFPTTDFQRKIRLPYSLIVMLKIIYFNRPNRDRTGAAIEKKLLTIMDRKNRALLSVDPIRSFYDYIYTYRFLRRHKFGKHDAAKYMSGFALFIFLGIKGLYKIDQKGIETSLKYIDENYALGWISYQCILSAHAYYLGLIFNPKDEERVYKEGVNLGRTWILQGYYLYGGSCLIESGNRRHSQHFIQRLKEVAEILENSYAMVQSKRLNAFYNLKFRNIEDTLEITEEAISLSIKTNHRLTIIGLYYIRSVAFSLVDKLEEARTNHAEMQKYLKGMKLSLFQTWYFIARSYIEIAEFELQNNGDSKTLLKTTKQLIKHAKKARKNLTESYRLRASVFWLLKDTTRAFKNFEKSIEAGITYDCKLELSRTYFEAGKFLQNSNNKKERINGMNGTECLMKAKSMFEEMNLEWDMKQYEKYMNGKFGNSQ